MCVRIPHGNLIQRQQQLGEWEVRESGCFVRLVFNTGSQPASEVPREDKKEI